MKVYLTLALMAMLTLCHAQEKFEKDKSVKDLKVTVKVLNEKMIVLTSDASANERYIADNLPDELKKDGLHLTISGDIGKIPANVRMAGTPFHICCIAISKGDEKKFKLAKRKYCFKQN